MVILRKYRVEGMISSWGVRGQSPLRSSKNASSGISLEQRGRFLWQRRKKEPADIHCI